MMINSDHKQLVRKAAARLIGRKHKWRYQGFNVIKCRLCKRTKKYNEQNRVDYAGTAYMKWFTRQCKRTDCCGADDE